MSIHPFMGHVPVLGKGAWIAPGAHVAGRVTLGEDVSIWYNAVLRADINTIVIGARSNIQDNAVIHLADNYGVELGEDVVVGHSAILHACKIGNNVLVGMGSIVMDGVEIGDDCVIAAGALVSPGKRIPAGSMVMGTPGKVVRETTQAERDSNRAMARKYMQIKDTFRGVAEYTL
ncbi:MAG: gamma carbonic anhydrase family protein [Fibrobacteres bacterium]|jgi:carbonic anhydrase/acetyltransferase-like protein (isoleucine patch superfamily)|nr:gamma carbonic anhydrase family protein [Fibrobacterota bacterium]